MGVIIGFPVPFPKKIGSNFFSSNSSFVFSFNFVLKRLGYNVKVDFVIFRSDSSLGQPISTFVYSISSQFKQIRPT